MMYKKQPLMEVHEIIPLVNGIKIMLIVDCSCGIVIPSRASSLNSSEVNIHNM